jgi:molybdopterin-binding protein
MEQSIRSQFPSTIKRIISDKVLSEVIVETGIGEVASVITIRSVEEMKLKTGDEGLLPMLFGSTGRDHSSRAGQTASPPH